jgi:branched-chain amino acid transport system ATP-binding protein
VDFAVQRGETVGLMGRNGMGKTTLLRSVLGLVRPRAGEVRIAGALMTQAAPYAIARKGIAYVPEGRGIFPNLSVRENLVMAASARRARATDLSAVETFRGWRSGWPSAAAAAGRRAADAHHRPRADDPSGLLILDEATEAPAPLVTRDLAHHPGDQGSRDANDHR